MLELVGPTLSALFSPQFVDIPVCFRAWLGQTGSLRDQIVDQSGAVISSRRGCDLIVGSVRISESAEE